MRWGLRAQAYYAPERRALDKTLALDIAALVPPGGVVSVELSSVRSRDLARLGAALRRLRRSLPGRDFILHCPTPRLDRPWSPVLLGEIERWTDEPVLLSAVILGNEPNAPSTWQEPTEYARWLDAVYDQVEESILLSPSWVLPALSFVGQGNEGDCRNPLEYARALLEAVGRRELFAAWAVNAYEDLSYLADLVAGLRGILDVPVWITEWGLPIESASDALLHGVDALEDSGAELAIYYVHHLHADAGGTEYGLREYLPSGRSHYTTGEATALWQPVAAVLEEVNQ